MGRVNLDIDKYSRAWIDTMIEIWQEKIERLNVIHSGELHESFSGTVNRLVEGASITMRFRRYGIYQALGVGNGYTRGNGGDLKILDPGYREAHGLNTPRRAGRRGDPYMTSGEPRHRRDWVTRKLYSSVMALREDVARIVGENATFVVCDALTDLRRSTGGDR